MTELPLAGLVKELAQRGLPVGTRDYLDALRALDLGFGCGSRKSLERLLIMLWGRTDLDERLIHQVVAQIAEPTESDLSLFSTPSSFNESRSTNDDLQPESAGEASPKARMADEVGVGFDGRDSRAGIPLPPAGSMSGNTDKFVLTPQTILSRRRLTIAWRRYRRMAAFSSTRGDIDIEACVLELGEKGVLTEPRRNTLKTNTARLAILADVSTSMTPWQPFLNEIKRSLTAPGLPDISLRCFRNDFDDGLTSDLDAHGSEDADEFLVRAAPLGVLIISDAGAARGFYNPSRVVRLKRFLARAHRICSRIVWINPMPPARWPRTTAAAVSQVRGVTFLGLSDQLLLRAVDILRGARTA